MCYSNEPALPSRVNRFTHGSLSRWEVYNGSKVATGRRLKWSFLCFRQIALLDSPTALSMEEKLHQNEARVSPTALFDVSCQSVGDAQLCVEHLLPAGGVFAFAGPGAD